MRIKTQFDFLNNRRVKIVATVGPASSGEGALRALIDAGVNIFRLNMSHGSHETHEQVCKRIRELREQTGVEVAVLVDLCGPKMRTGSFRGGAMNLVEGAEVTVTADADLGGDGVIVSQYPALAQDVSAGDRILLADGMFELCVLESGKGKVKCAVVHGGELGDNKGINLPDIVVSEPSLTEKDREDANFALEMGADFIALSFVREAADIVDLRRVIDAHQNQQNQQNSPGIVAKIEKPDALKNAEAILEAADAIMVARGDLGVELPPEQVPGAQAQLIRLAAERSKPVIVATQMLESMISNSRPTRAEVTDVSHAVGDGADAIMLSAETAVGAFPVEAVTMMDRIVRQTEAEIWDAGAYGKAVTAQEPPLPLWSVIAQTTARMSRDLKARAVMVITRSGKSAQIVSMARPAAPIIAVTNRRAVCRQLAINWGVVPVHEPEAIAADPSELARELALKLGLGKKGDYLLLVRGVHGEQVLNLPSVTVVEI